MCTDQTFDLPMSVPYADATRHDPDPMTVFMLHTEYVAIKRATAFDIFAKIYIGLGNIVRVDESLESFERRTEMFYVIAQYVFIRRRILYRVGKHILFEYTVVNAVQNRGKKFFAAAQSFFGTAVFGQQGKNCQIGDHQRT